MRKKLPYRRATITKRITYTTNAGVEQPLTVSYGVDGGEISEVFCSSFKVGSDMMALAIDASILLSRCLQHGDTIEELSATLSNSLIGAIVDEGVKLKESLFVLDRADPL